jgi:hypothetical protein
VTATAPRPIADIAPQLRADAEQLRAIADRLDEFSRDPRLDDDADALRTTASECRWKATELEVIAERVGARGAEAAVEPVQMASSPLLTGPLGSATDHVAAEASFPGEQRPAGCGTQGSSSK